MPSELQKHTWVFDSALYINVKGDSLTGYALDTVEQTITFTDAAVTRKTGGAGITLYNAVFENPNKVYYWLPTQPGKVENMFFTIDLVTEMNLIIRNVYSGRDGHYFIIEYYHAI